MASRSPTILRSSLGQLMSSRHFSSGLGGGPPDISASDIPAPPCHALPSSAALHISSADRRRSPRVSDDLLMRPSTSLQAPLCRQRHQQDLRMHSLQQHATPLTQSSVGRFLSRMMACMCCTRPSTLLPVQSRLDSRMKWYTLGPL